VVFALLDAFSELWVPSNAPFNINIEIYISKFSSISE
jgi:hypothetical protein